MREHIDVAMIDVRAGCMLFHSVAFMAAKGAWPMVYGNLAMACHDWKD
jgi:hypothetical protein